MNINYMQYFIKKIYFIKIDKKKKNQNFINNKIFIYKIALVFFKIKFLLILKIFIKLEDSLN